MNVMNQINSNPDYYPNTAIALCNISYDAPDEISPAVSAATNLDVVWGPAQLVSWDDVSYSLMFVARDAATGEYFVVIRGTNFDSLGSWLLQDFDVGSTQPFSALPGNPPNVPGNAAISQGTFNGMTDLLSLTDPTTGEPLLTFLADQKPSYLYVTGHSLGGTLTPPLFAYLNAMLYGGNSTNMALWSFAGLTPGGTKFNEYFNGLYPANEPGFLWRIQNSLDIAPLFWCAQASVMNIYAPYNLEWRYLEQGSIESLFYEANSAGIGYAQPQAGQVIPGQFVPSFPDDDSWALQALQQHHSATYLKLVKGKYPTYT